MLTSVKRQQQKQQQRRGGRKRGDCWRGKGRSKLLAKAKAAAFEALQFDEEADVPKTGLFALPFIVSITTPKIAITARAMEKQRNEARENALAILEQLEQAEADEEGIDGDSAAHVDRKNENEEAGHSGRLAFRDFAVASRAQNTERSKSKHDEGNDYADLDLEIDDDVEVNEDTKKRKFEMHPAKKVFFKSELKKVDPQENQKLGF